MTDRPTRDHYTITGHNGATLRREGDHYVMRGPGSEHRLLVSATDVGRLTVHWRGFSGWRGETFELAGAGRAALPVSTDLATTTDRPRVVCGRRFVTGAPRGGEGHYAYLSRMERNLGALVGKLVTTRFNCGWSRFIVVGISRDGHLRVRRLRTGDGYMNKTITRLDPSRTNVGWAFAERVSPRSI